MIIPAHEWPLLEPYAKGVSILEFGDKRNPSGLYRTQYVENKCSYTCVDINGRNGALGLDVRRPFDVGRFDLVTNFGFSEHVSKQAPFWANAHKALRVGGHHVGTLPKPNHWLHHGWSYWHPHEAFYQAWADVNGYEVVTLVDCGPGDPAKRMWGYVLKKVADLPHAWHFDSLFWRNPNWEIPADEAVFYGAA